MHACFFPRGRQVMVTSALAVSDGSLDWSKRDIDGSSDKLGFVILLILLREAFNACEDDDCKRKTMPLIIATNVFSKVGTL